MGFESLPVPPEKKTICLNKREAKLPMKKPSTVVFIEEKMIKRLENEILVLHKRKKYWQKLLKTAKRGLTKTH